MIELIDAKKGKQKKKNWNNTYHRDPIHRGIDCAAKSEQTPNFVQKVAFVLTDFVLFYQPEMFLRKRLRSKLLLSDSTPSVSSKNPGKRRLQF